MSQSLPSVINKDIIVKKIPMSDISPLVEPVKVKPFVQGKIYGIDTIDHTPRAGWMQDPIRYTPEEAQMISTGIGAFVGAPEIGALGKMLGATRAGKMIAGLSTPAIKKGIEYMRIAKPYMPTPVRNLLNTPLVRNGVTKVRNWLQNTPPVLRRGATDSPLSQILKAKQRDRKIVKKLF